VTWLKSDKTTLLNYEKNLKLLDKWHCNNNLNFVSTNDLLFEPGATITITGGYNTILSNSFEI
jgi:hypothetical protein